MRGQLTELPALGGTQSRAPGGGSQQGFFEYNGPGRGANGGDGGAIFNNGGAPTFTSCDITLNAAGDGGEASSCNLVAVHNFDAMKSILRRSGILFERVSTRGANR